MLTIICLFLVLPQIAFGIALGVVVYLWTESKYNGGKILFGTRAWSLLSFLQIASWAASLNVSAQLFFGIMSSSTGRCMIHTHRLSISLFDAVSGEVSESISNITTRVPTCILVHSCQIRHRPSQLFKQFQFPALVLTINFTWR